MHVDTLVLVQMHPSEGKHLIPSFLSTLFCEIEFLSEGVLELRTSASVVSIAIPAFSLNIYVHTIFLMSPKPQEEGKSFTPPWEV